MKRLIVVSILGFLLSPVLVAKDAARPNILFALADDWSYPHAGAYGCTWVKTPTFDRIARQGLLFTQAYTPTAKCAPSRCAILTGRNPWQLGPAANHISYFPPDIKSYAEALDGPYFVGMVMKGCSPVVALDKDGKHRNMVGKPFNARKLTAPTSEISSNDYAGNFTDFLDATPTNKPFCFWYGSVEPHRQYEYGSGVKLGGKKVTDIDSVPKYWPDNEIIRNDLLDYAFEVEHFDAQLGKMIAELEKRGLLDNTIVVVTGDNGMPFPRSKGNTYHVSNHLPLAVMWPAGIKNPGRTIKDFISFIDLAPTFVDLAGLDAKTAGMKPFEGRSFRDILVDKPQVVRDSVIIGRERNDVGRPHDEGYPTRGIVKGGWMYLHNFEPTRWPACNPVSGYLDCDGSPTKTEILKLRPAALWMLSFGMRPADELYNLESDPECLSNLAENPDHRARKQALRDELFVTLKKQEDPRVLGRGAEIDAYTHANKGSRGYYEKIKEGKRPPANWINPSDVQED
jgi:arylsulfatase A-like enzyme